MRLTGMSDPGWTLNITNKWLSLKDSVAFCLLGIYLPLKDEWVFTETEAEAWTWTEALASNCTSRLWFWMKNQYENCVTSSCFLIMWYRIHWKKKKKKKTLMSCRYVITALYIMCKVRGISASTTATGIKPGSYTHYDWSKWPLLYLCANAAPELTFCWNE